ncbi:PEP phosphonomutase-like protein [Aaosphaeria arxii CBS 175.79]|uniref:PEP phosphonomutase-like protein n=1 Tax=Aaosphaeria arxii CBS 175.79 TaxID=1450172 RepID=A0A6A5Y4M8_9PLEO|nr:PEP phosphonomutase-like protein [Aaosphaeria arxii CBS 175.79]KAF2019987.1 PEP phosphonomutase-like protein [Aaosphaeria arxii CBS 175.79]
MSSPQNEFAKTLKALHQPGNPVVLTNVWDAISARTVASIPETKAIATASYAVAAAAGLQDEDLTLEVEIAAVRAIAPVAREFNKPLTVDFQDGFGERLEEGLRAIIKAGAVGINLEDYGRELSDGKGGLYDVSVAQDRIQRVLKIAAEEGVPDFVINARTDALLEGRPLSEAIERGKAFLAAGAHNVFIWGGRARGGWSRQEVEEASKALGGRLNVSLRRVVSGGLTVQELSDIGVARISVGPQLMQRTQAAVAEEIASILRSDKV